jgi:hypothetical protein
MGIDQRVANLFYSIQVHEKMVVEKKDPFDSVVVNESGNPRNSLVRGEACPFAP